MKNLVLLRSFGSLFFVAALGCTKSGLGSQTYDSTQQSSTGVVASRVFDIQATASDNVKVTKVEFYVNGKLTCTVQNPPYTCHWLVPDGSGIAYQLKTIAYDAQNNKGESQVVNVTSR